MKTRLTVVVVIVLALFALALPASASVRDVVMARPAATYSTLAALRALEYQLAAADGQRSFSNSLHVLSSARDTVYSSKFSGGLARR